MCYKYGMEICKDVLKYLSENRFDQALSEMEIMEQEDISDRHYQELKNILHKYYYYEDIIGSVDKGRDSASENNISLHETLNDLCLRIVQFNQEHLVDAPISKC